MSTFDSPFREPTNKYWDNQMQMHIFIQFLAQRNALNEWLDCFNWISEVNGDDPYSGNGRVHGLLNDMRHAVGHISWSSSDKYKTFTDPEWEALNTEWISIHRDNFPQVTV